MLDLAKDSFILAALAFTSLILNRKATNKLKNADEISSTPNSWSALKKVALKLREIENIIKLTPLRTLPPYGTLSVTSVCTRRSEQLL